MATEVKNKAAAKAAEAPTSKVGEIKQASADSVRNQPTDEQLAQKRAESKPAKPKHVHVQTCSGGEMWDPDASQWITGRPTLAEDSGWMARQIKAHKIKFVE